MKFNFVSMQHLPNLIQSILNLFLYLKNDKLSFFVQTEYFASLFTYDRIIFYIFQTQSNFYLTNYFKSQSIISGPNNVIRLEPVCTRPNIRIHTDKKIKAQGGFCIPRQPALLTFSLTRSVIPGALRHFIRQYNNWQNLTFYLCSVLSSFFLLTKELLVCHTLTSIELLCPHPN